jgi:formylglycine-generating enzyme required for sulfatase activity
VPAGKLEMGCPHYAANCPEDEKPAHPIELGAYYIDRTEVTVGQFRRCVQSGGCREPGSGAEDCNGLRSERSDHPVNCVDWGQADGYCRWANKRLPTEAEWEKAARGTDGRTYPWGEQRPSCELAIMDEGGRGCGRDSTWPVGSRPAGESPYGASDMVGNVSEWVADGYDPAYYANSPRHDPRAQAVSSPRVHRGGSWRQTGPLRATSRDHWKPELWSIHLGFRCARSAS